MNYEPLITEDMQYYDEWGDRRAWMRWDEVLFLGKHDDDDEEEDENI